MCALKKTMRPHNNIAIQRSADKVTELENNAELLSLAQTQRVNLIRVVVLFHQFVAHNNPTCAKRGALL